MDSRWLVQADDLGDTVLDRMAKSGRAEIARMLLGQDSNDTHTESGMPPLHRAAYWGLEDAVREILADGADPSAGDSDGETPLHKAVRAGKMETVKTLLENGAEPDLPNYLGLTPLHWAALTGQKEIAETLLEHGADAHARDWVGGGMTPVDFARCMGYDDVATALEYHLAVR